MSASTASACSLLGFSLALGGLAALAPREGVAGTMGTSIPDGKDKWDICKPVHCRRDSAIGPADNGRDSDAF